MSGGFLSQVRHQRIGNPLDHEGLEGGEFGSFLLTAHRRTLPQLIAESHGRTGLTTAERRS